MIIQRSGLFFAALFSLAACSHAPRTVPIAAAVGVPPPRGADIPQAPPAPVIPSPSAAPAKVRPMCLARAESPLEAAPTGASEQRMWEIAFKNYYNGFLNAKGLREYIACLEKDGSPEALARRGKAVESLKFEEMMTDRARIVSSAEKRITDVKEIFSDSDGKTGLRRVIITFQDGATMQIDEPFDRAPVSKP